MQDRPMLPPAGWRTEQLFIVRIWHEISELHPGHWRGSVEHVPSGQRRYFASLDDLNEFILHRVAREAAPEGHQETARGRSPGRSTIAGGEASTANEGNDR